MKAGSLLSLLALVDQIKGGMHGPNQGSHVGSPGSGSHESGLQGLQQDLGLLQQIGDILDGGQSHKPHGMHGQHPHGHGHGHGHGAGSNPYDPGDIGGPGSSHPGSSNPSNSNPANPNPANPANPVPGSQPNPTTNPPTSTGSSGSGQVVSTGTGTGQNFNVTNNTGETQTFAFSANSSANSGYSNNVLATMTLAPGHSGTFTAGSNVPGIRINTSGPNGESKGNEALFEDTIEANPMGGGTVHNPDVSDVAGNVGYKGDKEDITVNDGTRTEGNGTQTGAYQYATQDTDPNRATNPMNMALDPSNTYNIVFSG